MVSTFAPSRSEICPKCNKEVTILTTDIMERGLTSDCKEDGCPINEAEKEFAKSNKVEVVFSEET